MNTGKIMIGAIVLLVAVWLAFINPTNSLTARFLGGGIVGIVGIFIIISGFKKEGSKKKQEQTEQKQEE